MGSYREQQEEEEDWAEEAAAAEEAEREAEEAEMVDRAEREFMLARGGGEHVQHGAGGGMDMDWDGFEQMDFE
jgi:Xaa-Pro aminopeptidase